ncbi:MAG TPA: hypothetical protein DCL48_01940, partial [Alphaproteobacteria bacterium]|nr:hypothetical protein [Alphaproteobacteria bacterium]
DIYAPRYREASIYRYIAAPEDIGQKAMDFAYTDVVRAFENFLARIGPDAPFILASHSQGTTHGFRLLAERVDGTALAERMIAAYLIGSKVKEAEAAALKTVKVCDAADQTGCLIHYAAFGPKGNPDETMDGLVCVNPLNWRKDGGPAEAQTHKGAVLPSGRFQNAFFTKDIATGVVFGPLGKPLPGLASARCDKGLLWVSEQTHPQLKALVVRGDNYHGLEYPLFHMDLRLNAAARIAAFANARGRPQP